MIKEPLLKCGTFGLHVIKNPAGNYSFVGSIPVELGERQENGDYKFPVFATEQEAIDYIKSKGIIPA